MENRGKAPDNNIYKERYRFSFAANHNLANLEAEAKATATRQPQMKNKVGPPTLSTFNSAATTIRLSGTRKTFMIVDRVSSGTCRPLMVPILGK